MLTLETNQLEFPLVDEDTGRRNLWQGYSYGKESGNLKEIRFSLAICKSFFHYRDFLTIFCGGFLLRLCDQMIGIGFRFHRNTYRLFRHKLASLLVGLSASNVAHFLCFHPKLFDDYSRNIVYRFFYICLYFLPNAVCFPRVVLHKFFSCHAVYRILSFRGLVVRVFANIFFYGFPYFLRDEQNNNLGIAHDVLFSSLLRSSRSWRPFSIPIRRLALRADSNVRRPWYPSMITPLAMECG